MTQAVHSFTRVSEHIAGAILALINARPRTPTQTEIAAVLASSLAAQEPANANLPLAVPARSSAPRLEPTRLGLEIIQLLPDHAEAVWHMCCLERDDLNELIFTEWEDATHEPIRDRQMQATNLADIAIAYRIATDGETPQDIIDGCKRRGEEVPTEEEAGGAMELMGTSAFLAHKLASAVLRQAGIPELECSISAIFRQRGWMEAEGIHTREPTAAERREALVQLEA